MDLDQLAALSEHWSADISGRADNKVASFSHGGGRLGEALLRGTRPPCRREEPILASQRGTAGDGVTAAIRLVPNHCDAPHTAYLP